MTNKLSEKAQALTTYSNFWKQFYRKFPQYRQATVTARDFEPGERVEVDYAGDALEWIELSTGEIRKAYVFVAGLGFSQLLKLPRFVRRMAFPGWLPPEKYIESNPPPNGNGVSVGLAAEERSPESTLDYQAIKAFLPGKGPQT